MGLYKKIFSKIGGTTIKTENLSEGEIKNFALASQTIQNTSAKSKSFSDDLCKVSREIKDIIKKYPRLIQILANNAEDATDSEIKKYKSVFQKLKENLSKLEYIKNNEIKTHKDGIEKIEENLTKLEELNTNAETVSKSFN